VEARRHARLISSNVTRGLITHYKCGMRGQRGSGEGLAQRIARRLVAGEAARSRASAVWVLVEVAEGLLLAEWQAERRAWRKALTGPRRGWQSHNVQQLMPAEC